jgi:PAS domain S-box-containing protein
METQMIDRFGNQIWLRETAVKHIFPNGDTGHLSILEDISQRKENEAKIRAYQENLEYLIKARTHELENSNRQLSKLYKAIEFSPSTVVITDKNGTIEYVNPHFCRVTGYSYEESIGENPRIVKSNDTPAEYYAKLWETILSGKSWHGQFKNRKKNGETFWELCSIAPILDVNNEITHFVAVKQDITESIVAEEKMKNYTKELEVFNKTMIDRELRMIEMKEEVNKMCRQLGIPEKYATTWNV